MFVQPGINTRGVRRIQDSYCKSSIKPPGVLIHFRPIWGRLNREKTMVSVLHKELEYKVEKLKYMKVFSSIEYRRWICIPSWRSGERKRWIKQDLRMTRGLVICAGCDLLVEVCHNGWLEDFSFLKVWIQDSGWLQDFSFPKSWILDFR